MHASGEPRPQTAGQSLLLALVCLAAVLVVLVSTSRYGIGISPDSVDYVAAARNLLEGRGLLQHDLTPFVGWPPLFPGLLALMGLAGVDPLLSARFLNAAAFALIIYLAARWIFRRSGSFPLALVFSISLLVSTPLLYVSKMAWTEPLFILLILLFLLTFERYFATGSRWALTLTSGIAALLCLTRYAGVAVILTGVVFLLLDRTPPFRRRVPTALYFAILAGLPLCLWFARNLAVSSTLAGARYPAEFGPERNLLGAVAHVAYWVVPYAFPKTARVIVGTVVISALAVAVLKSAFGRAGERERARAAETHRVLVFMLVYSGYLVVSASLVAFDVIGDRLLSPIYVPWLVLSLSAIWPLVRPAGPGRAAPRALAIAALGAWITLSCLTGLERMTGWIEYGAGGFATKRWQRSEVAAYARAHVFEGAVYSNFPLGFYVLTGKPASLSPRRHAYRSPEVPMDDIAGLKQELGSRPATLAWFDGPETEFLLSLSEIEEALDVELVAVLSDGRIYRMGSPGNRP